jgi:hypothetical protein
MLVEASKGPFIKICCLQRLPSSNISLLSASYWMISRIKPPGKLQLAGKNSVRLITREVTGSFVNLIRSSFWRFRRRIAGK